MSLVTDVVFVTPDREASDRFATLFASFTHGRRDSQYEITPIEENGGGKVSSTHVFHLGVNYLNWDFPDAVESQEWPPGTVFYRWHEDADPVVKTW